MWYICAPLKADIANISALWRGDQGSFHTILVTSVNTVQQGNTSPFGRGFPLFWGSKMPFIIRVFRAFFIFSAVREFFNELTRPVNVVHALFVRIGHECPQLKGWLR